MNKKTAKLLKDICIGEVFYLPPDVGTPVPSYYIRIQEPGKMDKTFLCLMLEGPNPLIIPKKAWKVITHKSFDKIRVTTVSNGLEKMMRAVST